ncbi:uncharacterized protein LOC142907050 isoform X2 [Petromyzon marinus]
MYCWITAFLLELLLLEAPSTNSDHASSVVQKVVIISSGNLQTNATWEKCCSRAPVKVDTSHVRDQDPPVVESRSARSSPARGATGSPATPRTRAGRAAGVCTQLWRGECGGNSTPAAPLAYLKLRAGPGAPRGSWHGYNATRTRREETDSYVDVSDSKQYSSSVKMWTTDLSQTPILHRGPHALHTSHVSSEPQQRRLDVPACPLNDT